MNSASRPSSPGEPEEGAPVPPDSVAPSQTPSEPPAAAPGQAAAPAAPAAPAAQPPPPPPPPPAAPTSSGFDATGPARALFSQLDPTGFRPTAMVAAIIFALFFGSQLVNAIIPQAAVGPGVPGPVGPGPVGPGPTPGPVNPGPNPVSTPLPPGSTLTVGPLRIPLESGWTPQEVANSNIIVRLVKGGTAVDVFSASLQGQADAAAVYRFYIQDMQANAQGFTASPPNLLQIGNGIPAARGSYTGVFGQSQVEGQVTTMVTGSSGFIFDIWAQSGSLGTLLPEAQRMIDSIQIQ